ncbi:MAG: type I DNA topoisomerase [Peptostreptococcales bacterium]
MADKSLVIVESPAKAKTIGKFLGSKYKVVASVGHIRDLPKSTMGIDIENNFEPKYINIRGKGDVIKEMKKEAKKSKKVMLATDPDREGEAISWHIAHILGIDENEKCRIEFNEITKKAITNAVKSPREIDRGLVDAQQARRVLDRLVGYSISPLLWRKIRRGLSAGRVQSAALKIICDRDKQIANFQKEEYWSLHAELYPIHNEKEKFKAKLIEHDSKKIAIANETEAHRIIEAIKDSPFTVKKIENKERSRKPLPPFTTSSLQQEASNRLNFFTKRTMMAAQQLYEGIDIKGMGTVGLVTYIRTDSTRISDEARVSAKEYITENYSKKHVGNHIYKNPKKKDVQDAHEAIRPTYIELHPEQIKDFLSKDQYKLYQLIWERFVASQMAAAVYDNQSIDIENNNYLFRANGSQLKFDGFLKVYSFMSIADNIIPELKEGEILEKEALIPEQHFTQPPAKFTEASLVKELEEKNIGRPSTYVPIINTLLARRYIERDKKILNPTELGFVVTELMEKYFKNIVDEKFTANMEQQLDEIEEKKIQWKNVIDDFFVTFQADLESAEEEISKITIEDELTDQLCDKCGKPMAIKHGRYGDFLACSGYPECKNAKPLLKGTGVKCPECGEEIVERTSKKGRVFYGCGGYPNCKFVLWNKPTHLKCSNCNSIMVEKKTKKYDYQCANKDCGYTK